MNDATAPRLTRVRRRALTMIGSSAVVVLGVIWGTAGPAAAADQAIDLYAVHGSATMPNGASVNVLGYSTTNAAVTAPGGPVIVVDQGDSVTITLHNQLGLDGNGDPVRTSLLVKGQPLQPDLTGVADGETTTYTFSADEPGTFLYEAGLLPNTEYQTAMGLHGALVVRAPDGGAGEKYAYTDTATQYDSAAVLVLSEVDPALNNRADPSTFDMRNFAPRYFLVDGKAHPQIDAIAAASDSDVLLRYVNAGVTNHSMGVLGASGQRVIAMDGYPLAYSRSYVADTIGPGQTLDAIVHVPATGPVVQRLSVYDANLRLRNANTAGMGGMLATIEVPETAPTGDDLGPLTSGATWSADVLEAQVSDAGRGGATVTEARAYFDDLSTTPVALTAQDGAFDSATELVSGAVPVASGEHTIYVQGFDGTTWGPLTSVLVTGADAGGPTVVQPVLTPNITRQPAPTAVTISATGDDSATGNSNVVAAEYSVGDVAADAGTGTAMTVTSEAPVAELTGTLGTAELDALAEGNHPVWVRAQDAQGNWGEAVTVNLAVDLHAPAIESAVVVEKTPNNGLIPLTTSQQVVRVSVQQIVDNSFASVFGNVAKVEMYLDDHTSANAIAIPMTPSDGLFNDQAEGAYADIPLATVRQMTDGDHTVYVRARDNAGNWSDVSSGTLVVDKTAPVVNSLTITPNPAVGVSTLTAEAVVTETGTGVTAGEWWLGTAPAPGSGTPLGSLSVTGPSPSTVTGTINAADLGEGTFAVRVRFRDATGNWGAPSTANVTVTPAIYLSTLGNTNPPGLTGTADDADVLFWNGTGYAREFDASVAGFAGSADMDGFDRVDATHFYASFAPDNVTIPGLGQVQDEDVVYYNDGTWEMFFNGTAAGLTGSARDVDAINVSADGTRLFFSTRGNSNPPGVGGAADDADIYRYDLGSQTFSRVFDATANGLPNNTNVDGVVWVSSSQLYLSFAPNNTSVAGLGNVPDENVVFLRGGVWRTYFNGAAHGLNTSGNLDIDAFDLP